MKVIKSRNQREGTYKACRFGKHFRSANKLCLAAREFYGNPWAHITAAFHNKERQ